MDEKQAREILHDINFEFDGGIFSDVKYLAWIIGNSEATLGGEFTAKELVVDEA